MSVEKKSVSASGKIGLAKKIPLARGAYLRFPLALEQVARVSRVGGVKYSVSAGNMDYLLIPDAEGVFIDAQARHMKAERVEGPVNIEKGGALPKQGMALLHSAQAAWNALARLEKQLRGYKEAGIDINELLDRAPEVGQSASVGFLESRNLSAPAPPRPPAREGQPLRPKGKKLGD